MTVKRFIAGAVCPRCGEMDRLVSFEEAGHTYRECVSCDFSEKLVAQIGSSEIKTRVNQIPSEDDENSTSPVKIIDLGKSH